MIVTGTVRSSWSKCTRQWQFLNAHTWNLLAFLHSIMQPATLDALVTKRMSKGYSGKQPKMCATFWENGQCQFMVIESDFFQFDKKTKQMVNLRGEPKGLEWVL